jgi:hypothetical protein
MLTVAETLRPQGRPVFGYLVEAITAYRQGQPAPQVLQAG